MAKNDNYYANQANPAGSGKIDDMENWRDEHGNPSYEYLQGLAEDGGPGALEKLRSIAEDLDVEYSPGASSEELVNAIMSATEDDPNDTT